MYIVCLIPARGGSKGIPGKNIKMLNNKPLIAHSIEQAKRCSYISRTIVTTDSEDIADIARQYGAEVPFLRPKAISQDLSTDMEFFDHYLSFEKDSNNPIPDLIVHLRPTTPDRTDEDLNSSIKIMIDRFNDYDSLRSVVPYAKSPFKMYVANSCELIPLFNEVDGKKEPYNLCRQDLPQAYLHNGYIDIIKTSCIENKRSLTGDKIYPYIMKDTDVHDLDTIQDWITLEKKMGLA